MHPMAPLVTSEAAAEADRPLALDPGLLADLGRVPPPTFVEGDRRRGVLGLARHVHAERILPSTVVRFAPLHEGQIVVRSGRRVRHRPGDPIAPDGYDAAVQPPVTSDTWIDLTEDELPIGAVYEWCVRPDCGAVVLFSGTVRDHAVDEPARCATASSTSPTRRTRPRRCPAFEAIAAEARARVAATSAGSHCCTASGGSSLGESSVIAAVSSPHRPEAFEAARYRDRRVEGERTDLEARVVARSDGADGVGLGNGRARPRRPGPRVRHAGRRPAARGTLIRDRRRRASS